MIQTHGRIEVRQPVKMALISTHDIFRHAIDANPHDPAPWHVYADYLHEQGQHQQAQAARHIAEKVASGQAIKAIHFRPFGEAGGHEPSWLWSGKHNIIDHRSENLGVPPSFLIADTDKARFDIEQHLPPGARIGELSPWMSFATAWPTFAVADAPLPKGTLADRERGHVEWDGDSLSAKQPSDLIDLLTQHQPERMARPGQPVKMASMEDFHRAQINLMGSGTGTPQQLREHHQVFSDWLTDQGDPHARIVQADLSPREPGNPQIGDHYFFEHNGPHGLYLLRRGAGTNPDRVWFQWTPPDPLTGGRAYYGGVMPMGDALETMGAIAGRDPRVIADLGKKLREREEEEQRFLRRWGGSRHGTRQSMRDRVKKAIRMARNPASEYAAPSAVDGALVRYKTTEHPDMILHHITATPGITLNEMWQKTGLGKLTAPLQQRAIDKLVSQQKVKVFREDAGAGKFRTRLFPFAHPIPETMVPSKLDQIIGLKQQGHANVEIARRLGVTRERVYQALLTANHRRLLPQTTAKVEPPVQMARVNSGDDPHWIGPLFHGTSALAFKTFDTSSEGAHFGTYEQARSHLRRKPGGGGRHKIIGAYLNIRNPLRVPDLGVFSDFNGVHRHLSVNDHITPEQADAAWNGWQQSDKAGWQALKDALAANGHDGFVYENELEGPGDSYVAFHPHQIRIESRERLSMRSLVRQAIKFVRPASDYERYRVQTDLADKVPTLSGLFDHPIGPPPHPDDLRTTGKLIATGAGVTLGVHRHLGDRYRITAHTPSGTLLNHWTDEQTARKVWDEFRPHVETFGHTQLQGVRALAAKTDQDDVLKAMGAEDWHPPVQGVINHGPIASPGDKTVVGRKPPMPETPPPRIEQDHIKTRIDPLRPPEQMQRAGKAVKLGREQLPGLHAAVAENPMDLFRWAPLADALAESGYPWMSLVARKLLHANDSDKAFRLKHDDDRQTERFELPVHKIADLRRWIGHGMAQPNGYIYSMIGGIPFTLLRRPSKAWHVHVENPAMNNIIGTAELRPEEGAGLLHESEVARASRYSFQSEDDHKRSTQYEKQRLADWKAKIEPPTKSPDYYTQLLLDDTPEGRERRRTSTEYGQQMSMRDRVRQAIRFTKLTADTGTRPQAPTEASKPTKERSLPAWVPVQDPDDPNTGFMHVKSGWIAGLRYTREGGIEMVVKKGGKQYPYPGFRDLATFRSWVKSASPGRWWWAHVGRPMMEHNRGHASHRRKKSNQYSMRDRFRQAIRLSRRPVRFSAEHIEPLKAAIRRNPLDPMPRMVLADTHAEMGNHEAADDQRLLAKMAGHIGNEVDPYDVIAPINGDDGDYLFNSHDSHEHGFAVGQAEKAAWINANEHLPGLAEHRPVTPDKWALGPEGETIERFADGTFLHSTPQDYRRRHLMEYHPLHLPDIRRSLERKYSPEYSGGRGPLTTDEEELLHTVFGPGRASQIMHDWNDGYHRYQGYARQNRRR